MTQAEKARAYDEALGKAEEFYNDKNNIQCANAEGMLEEIFPELKESEDEKTRKRIIALVNAHGQGMYKDDMLAWLENIPYTIDHEKREGFHLGYKAALEKQGEQKPQRIISAEAKEAMYDKLAWGEKDEKEYKYVLKFVDNILNNCGNKKDYEHCKRCYDWLKSLKQRIGG